MDQGKRLIGKRVLLIMPNFFGYQNEIRRELERQGAIVDWLPDRPFESPVLMALTKIGPKIILPFTDFYYKSRLKNLSGSSYDKIFVINGQTVSYKILNHLRIENPNAEFVLYMWDSIKNRPNVLKNVSCFDKIFSFDTQSAKKYGFKHRPLFFLSGFRPSLSSDFSYHLSFIGTIHSDRYEIINRVKKSLPPQLTSYWYLYLQAPWVYHAYRLYKADYKNSKIGEFNFKPLDKTLVQLKFAQSLSVLDIEHPNQNGLTMRSLEAFGAHKKLITTNQSIRDYDFYSPNNICIIDRKNPQIPNSFFKEAFTPPELNLYQRYSLEGWVNEILT